MHTLLCNVARTGDISNNASCIASGMHTKSFPGNFRGLGSMTSVWAVDLNLHVSIPYLQALEAQVHHSEHFSKPLFGSVHTSNGSGEHHLSGTMLLVSQCWRTVQVDGALWTLSMRTFWCDLQSRMWSRIRLMHEMATDVVLNLLVGYWKPHQWVYIAVSCWYRITSRCVHIVHGGSEKPKAQEHQTKIIFKADRNVLRLVTAFEAQQCVHVSNR